MATMINVLEQGMRKLERGLSSADRNQIKQMMINEARAAYMLEPKPFFPPEIPLDVLEFVEMQQAKEFQMLNNALFNFGFTGRGERMPGPPLKQPSRDAIGRLPVQVLDNAGSEPNAGFAREIEELLGYSVLRRSLKLTGRLGLALAKLEIEPLNREHVETYKKGMQAWLQREIDNRPKKKPANAWGPKVVVTAAWNEVPLAGYKEEVPLFAMHKALEIKKECPGVAFFVDELREETRLVDPFLVAKFEEEEFIVEVWGEAKFEATL